MTCFETEPLHVSAVQFHLSGFLGFDDQRIDGERALAFGQDDERVDVDVAWRTTASILLIDSWPAAHTSLGMTSLEKSSMDFMALAWTCP